MFARRQRGAAAVFAGIAMTAMLAAVALTIDIGRLYFAQRDLQNAAALAALDAARAGSGCYSTLPDTAGAAFDAAQQASLLSIQRNGLPDEALERVQIGSPTTAGSGLRSFASGDGLTRFAVEVVLIRDAPGRLIPGLTSSAESVDGRRLRASAAAQVANDVTVSVGSFGARVSPTAPGALLSLLPGAIDIAALDYSALIDAEVRLDDIFEPGSVSELLQAFGEETPLPVFLDAVGDALLATNQVAAAATVAAIGAASDAGQMLIPADIINLESNVAPLLGGATVSAGALVEAALQSVLIDGVFEALIELGGGREVAITLREEPQVDVGPPGLTPGGEEITESRTAQGRAVATVPLVDLLPTGTNLRLFVEAAQARAAVTGVRCPRAGQPQSEARIRTRTGVAEIGLEPIDVDVRLSSLLDVLGISGAGLRSLLGGPSSLVCNVPLLGALAGGICDLLDDNPLLNLSVTMPPIMLPGTDESRWVPGPFPNSFSVSAPPSAPLSNLIEGSLDVQISVAGTPPTGAVGDILNDTLNLLRPPLNALLVDAVGATLDEALQPVLADLGVSLAGADVTVSSFTITPPTLFVTVAR